MEWHIYVKINSHSAEWDVSWSRRIYVCHIPWHPGATTVLSFDLYLFIEFVQNYSPWHLRHWMIEWSSWNGFRVFLLHRSPQYWLTLEICYLLWFINYFIVAMSRISMDIHIVFIQPESWYIYGHNYTHGIWTLTSMCTNPCVSSLIRMLRIHQPEGSWRRKNLQQIFLVRIPWSLPYTCASEHWFVHYTVQNKSSNQSEESLSNDMHRKCQNVKGPPH